MTARISTSDCHLYKVTDTVRGNFYIGKHNGRIQQGYWGSGLRINRHKKKYGKQDLVYKILVIADEKYIFELEQKYVTDEFIKENPLCLNLCNGGMGGNFNNVPWNKGKKMPDEVRKKQSLAKIGKVGNRKGSTVSEETKTKMSASKKGKTNITEAGRRALSLAHFGRKHKILICPHCNKTGGLTAMPRWHFENCRLKEQPCLPL